MTQQLEQIARECAEELSGGYQSEYPNINPIFKAITKAVEIERNNQAGLFALLADIRAAVGDPTGKMMQDELVEHCRQITKERNRVCEWKNIGISFEKSSCGLLWPLTKEMHFCPKCGGKIKVKEEN